jgi:hypothetical protein
MAVKVLCDGHSIPHVVLYEAYWDGLSVPLTTMQAEELVWQELEETLLNDEFV